MGKRIKVTGYLYPEDLDPAHVDLSHETGLSEDGYMALPGRIELDDIATEVEEFDE